MNNHISLTVPSDDKKALVAGATMLLTLAGKVPEIELDDTVADTTALNSLTAKVQGHVETTPPPPEETIAATSTTTPPPEDDAAKTEDTTPPPVDVQLDKHGLPWDPRIHAGTKALLADGAWRYKQGVDRAELVPQVEEELRKLMSAPGATETTTPPPETTTTTPPPAADSDAPTTFPAFLKAVSGLIGAGTTTMVAVNAVINNHDIASIQLVNAREDLIPLIWAEIVGGNE